MMGSCRPGGSGFVALWQGKNKAWADSARGEVHTRLAQKIGEYARRGLGGLDWKAATQWVPQETVQLNRQHRNMLRGMGRKCMSKVAGSRSRYTSHLCALDRKGTKIMGARQVSRSEGRDSNAAQTDRGDV